MAPKGWKLTGWQGITLSTPATWNLVGYGGDESSGNIRLDNGEASTSSVQGVELRWSRNKAAQSDSALETRLDQFFANIRKTAKREKLPVDTRSRIVEPGIHPERVASRSFQWKADRKGIGRIWYCGHCKRLIIAQVVTGLKGDHSAIAHDLLNSITCHSREAEWRAWSLYDLQTEIPPAYKLKGKPQLLNIYVSLAFERAPNESIVVEQWGVANVQLRNKYLDDWFREKSPVLITRLRYDTSEIEVHGHAALSIEGKMRGLAYWFNTALPQLFRLQLPAPYYAACLWECPDSNKIHQVQVFGRKPCGSQLAEIVERTLCH